MPWKFEPEQTEIKVRVGEVTTVHYTITNEVAATTMGQAAYNVTPLTVGSYFTMPLMAEQQREIPAADASTQAGKWEKNRFMGVEITDRKERRVDAVVRQSGRLCRRKHHGRHLVHGRLLCPVE